MDGRPRIAPGSRTDIGLVNAAIARVVGIASGGPPPRVFTTLARHRRLFRRWLRFAAALMPGGRLPRDETELVILRVAHNTGSEYEWRQHEQIGRAAGLSAEEVARVREGSGAAGWSDRRRLLLRAVDELHADRDISDGVWGGLAREYDERELIELCMLTGHYEMLAMALKSLRVEPDERPVGARAGRLLPLRGRRASRRSAG